MNRVGKRLGSSKPGLILGVERRIREAVRLRLSSENELMKLMDASPDALLIAAMLNAQRAITDARADMPVLLECAGEYAQLLTDCAGVRVRCCTDGGAFEAIVGQIPSIISDLPIGSMATDVELARRVAKNHREKTETAPRITVRFGDAHQPGTLEIFADNATVFTPAQSTALQILTGMLTSSMMRVTEDESREVLLDERAATLAALRDSEERFQCAFRDAAIGMAIVGLDGRWMQVNPSLCRILGYTEVELLSRDFQSVTHPLDLEADLDLCRQLITGEIRDYQLQKRYFHSRGHIVWTALSVSLVRTADGKPRYFISQIQDITERKSAEEALLRSEENYRNVFELASVGKARADLKTGRFLQVNKKLCEITGFTRESLLEKSFLELEIGNDDAVSPDAVHEMLQTGGNACTFDTEFRCGDGRIAWVRLDLAVLCDTNGQPDQAIVTVQDITDQKRMECVERDRRSVLEMVARDTPIATTLAEFNAGVQRQFPGAFPVVMLVQGNEISLHASHLPAQLRQTLHMQYNALAANLVAGLDPENPDATVYLPHQILAQIFHPAGDAAPLTAALIPTACWAMSLRASSGTQIGWQLLFPKAARGPVEFEIRLLDTAAKLASICIEHHNATRQLHHLVRHDPLTGLPNRVLLEDRITQAIAMSNRSKKPVGLMVLDIDHFKKINDTLGHQAGDHLLQQIARRLSGRMRKMDTFARMGGDEFVAVLPELQNPGDASLVAKKLLDALIEPMAIGGTMVSVGISIGIALYPQDGADGPTLHQRADAALYRVKQKGRNGFSF